MRVEHIIAIDNNLSYRVQGNTLNAVVIGSMVCHGSSTTSTEIGLSIGLFRGRTNSLLLPLPWNTHFFSILMYVKALVENDQYALPWCCYYDDKVSGLRNFTSSKQSFLLQLCALLQLLPTVLRTKCTGETGSFPFTWILRDAYVIYE